MIRLRSDGSRGQAFPKMPHPVFHAPHPAGATNGTGGGGDRCLSPSVPFACVRTSITSMSNQPVLLTLQRRYTSSAIEDILLGQSKYIPNFASIHLLTSVHGAGLKTRQALSLGLCPRFQTFASRTIKNLEHPALAGARPTKRTCAARAGQSFGGERGLNLVECLLEVIDDVIDMLHTDAQTDGGGSDVLLGQFLG